MGISGRIGEIQKICKTSYISNISAAQGGGSGVLYRKISKNCKINACLSIFLWILVDFRGFSLIFMDFMGLPWIFVDVR